MYVPLALLRNLLVGGYYPSVIIAINTIKLVLSLNGQTNLGGMPDTGINLLFLAGAALPTMRASACEGNRFSISLALDFTVLVTIP
jgi:hypothetical protein